MNLENDSYMELVKKAQQAIEKRGFSNVREINPALQLMESMFFYAEKHEVLVALHVTKIMDVYAIFERESGTPVNPDTFGTESVEWSLLGFLE